MAPADLTLAPIRLMEPAIIARLRIAFPAKDFTIERVPPTLTLNEFGRIARLSPFIGLAWAGMQPDKSSGRQLQADWGWRLVLIVKATSSLEARFKGDTRDMGLDGMSDVAIALLQGAVFENIGDCAVSGAQAVFAEGWSDDATVVAWVDFSIRTTTSPAAHKLITEDDFTNLGVQWLNPDADDPAGQLDASQEIDVPEGEI